MVRIYFYLLKYLFCKLRIAKKVKSARNFCSKMKLRRMGMDWIQGIQNAIDYIEEHITEEIDYANVAKIAYSSSFHFQRVFGITCGITLGEYIRKRRLTLAGNELLAKETTVTNVAFKYGYNTAESFSRAFTKFHGIKPSRVKQGCSLKSFPKLTVKIDMSESSEMNYKNIKMKYKIIEKPELVLVGYKSRFKGVPYGVDRAEQEGKFCSTTRAKQWLLIGASCDYSTDYCIITHIGDDGYDFYIAYELDEWTRKELFNPQTTGVDFMDKMGFETLVIPRTMYAVFETDKQKRPIGDYIDIRKKIVTEWLPSSGYLLADAPEVVIMHWRPKGEWDKERYIEICLPIEKK